MRLLRHGSLLMVMAGLLLRLAAPAGAQTTQAATTTAASTVSTLGVGETKDFFTIVALPDPQNYNDKHPEMFRKQVEWIAAHAKDEHVAFATCEGDIVEHGNKIEEWDAADKSLSLLDGTVPWGVAIGNHDFDVRNDVKRPATAFVKHFGPERFAKQAWFGGASENGLSSFQLVEAAGVKLMILHLEIAAPEEAATWAGKVLAEHPDRATVVVTHI